VVAVLAIPSAASADIYKCTKNGQVTFSDMPCAPAAKPIEVQVYMPSDDEAARAQERANNVQQELASNSKQRQLAALDREIEIKNNKLNNELDALRFKKTRAANNLAGAAWENSISAEMQAVTLRYQNEIEALNKQRAALLAK